jgi:hypothetical protein
MNKNRKIKKGFKWISLVVGLTLVFTFISPAEPGRATGSSLYLSPSSGTFFVGSTFDVSIFVNTGGNHINAVKVDLKFDPRKLQIASPTAGKSFISVWVSQPTYSNKEGKASFQGGIPSPGIHTSSGLVSTITFRAVAPGEAFISILDSSQVLLDDGKGTDILSSIGRGMYKISVPPPEGPQVFSSTHSDQNKWYKDSNITFNWEKEPGVTDFSYSLDHDFHGIPDNISEGSHTSVSYTDLEDGIWYFHLKAKKGGNWGGVTHYLVQIDTPPPAAFKLRFEPELKSPVSTSKEPIVYFITTDSLSGLDHFELKVIDLRKDVEKREEAFFVEVNSPYKLPPLDFGEHEIIVRAYDGALNEQNVSERIDVLPIDKAFYITKKGINIWTLFFPWRRVVLILIIIAFLIIIYTFFRRRRHKGLHRRKRILEEIKGKVRENSESIKRKLHGE